MLKKALIACLLVIPVSEDVHANEWDNDFSRPVLEKFMEESGYNSKVKELVRKGFDIHYSCITEGAEDIWQDSLVQAAFSELNNRGHKTISKNELMWSFFYNALDWQRIGTTIQLAELGDEQQDSVDTLIFGSVTNNIYKQMHDICVGLMKETKRNFQEPP